MPKTSDKRMSTSGNLIREAEEFSNEDSGSDLNPVQLIKKHIISADEAFIAKDMLTIQKLENQKRISDLKKEIADEHPPRQQMASAQNTLLGTTQNNNPPIVSILNALPEEDRKDFLEKNKEAIFQQSITAPSNAPMMAQLLARQQQQQSSGGTELNGFANLLLAVNAMSESRAQSERELMVNMMTMISKTNQPAPNNNDGALAKLLERMNQKIDETTTAIKGEVESIKNDYQQRLIDAQKEAMNTQVELVKTQYGSQIEQLQKAIEARGNQETFAHNIQGMIQNLQAAGVNLTNETAEQERIRRDYALQERRLDIQAEESARKHAVELENA